MVGVGTGTAWSMGGGAEARSSNDAGRSNILKSDVLEPESREIGYFARG